MEASLQPARCHWRALPPSSRQWTGRCFEADRARNRPININCTLSPCHGLHRHRFVVVCLLTQCVYRSRRPIASLTTSGENGAERTRHVQSPVSWTLIIPVPDIAMSRIDSVFHVQMNARGILCSALSFRAVLSSVLCLLSNSAVLCIAGEVLLDMHQLGGLICLSPLIIISSNRTPSNSLTQPPVTSLEYGCGEARHGQS